MPIGRTPEEAAQDQKERDRQNLELRNHDRGERGLPPISMQQYLEKVGGRDKELEAG